MDPKKTSSDIVAGIVTYNPEIPRLLENLRSIVSQVDAVLIQDNGSSNPAAINELAKEFPSVRVQKNDKNLGIAAALNQVMNWAENQEAGWAVLLDQDSVCQDGFVANLSKDAPNDAGIIAPSILDRSSSLSHSAEVERVDPKQQEVDFCITSGSLCRVDTWRSIGGYDSRMFIDFVDFDYCLRLRMAGHRIVRRPHVVLLHEIGKIKRFGPFIAYNHSAARSYHMARDMIFYAKKHASAPRNLKVQKRGLLLTILVLCRKMIIVLFFEEEKFIRVTSLLRGTLAGIFGRTANA